MNSNIEKIPKFSNDQEFYQYVDKYLIKNNSIYNRYTFKENIGRDFIIFIVEKYLICKKIGNLCDSGCHLLRGIYKHITNPFMEIIKNEY